MPDARLLTAEQLDELAELAFHLEPAEAGQLLAHVAAQAEQIERLRAELATERRCRANWEASAAVYCRNSDYWRELAEAEHDAREWRADVDKQERLAAAEAALAQSEAEAALCRQALSETVEVRDGRIWYVDLHCQADDLYRAKTRLVKAALAADTGREWLEAADGLAEVVNTAAEYSVLHTVQSAAQAALARWQAVRGGTA